MTILGATGPTLDYLQVPNRTGTGVYSVCIPYSLQMFYENLSEFGKKVNLGNKVQLRYKVTGERNVSSMDDITHMVMFQINIYIRERVI